ncbi:tyrosine-type recombinase/integrase [Paremcibacter congregatus]|uniref:Integrase n=1 Tax=Paremcibacter congregatus TaxID=2043170 RepID=A0A2G4YMF2_9PROT|nr:site-specific integrase [Paremcibacter congregatus]PHZ83477.1 integrase [Paremcibacter congregatus]QDE28056.1 site-specific integrase [Paremcibacter congregatus]
MALGKQAKTLNSSQQKAVLNYLQSTRSPVRNKVIFLLSLKAGLRAKEISQLTWRMITTSSGEISDCISLTNSASKGSSGGVIWLNSDLSIALHELWSLSWQLEENDYVITSERRGNMSAQAIVNIFSNWYKQMGFEGCSSHSGRRTFITNAARKISTVGGSMRDVQMLARHSSLLMTQRYIESDVDAMKRVVQLI